MGPLQYVRPSRILHSSGIGQTYPLRSQNSQVLRQLPGTNHLILKTQPEERKPRRIALPGNCLWTNVGGSFSSMFCLLGLLLSALAEMARRTKGFLFCKVAERRGRRQRQIESMKNQVRGHGGRTATAYSRDGHNPHRCIGTPRIRHRWWRC